MIPSDEDLNRLLRAWTIPESPDSLERRLRRAYRERTRPQSRRWLRELPSVWTRWVAGLSPAAGLFAGITAGAVMFLLVMAEAFPQSLAGLSGTASSFTVDYEEIEYKADGSSAIRELFTSAGGGLVLSREFPGDPVRTAEQRILLDPLNLILYWIATPVRERAVARQEVRINALKARNPELMAKLIAERERTCVPGPSWTAAGNEMILNYAAKGIQKIWMEEGKPVRLTEWPAPDLHCVTLKSTTEKMFDGRLRLVFEQRALKVTMNTPATKLPGPGAEPMTHPER
jgi:hypothetical protein